MQKSHEIFLKMMKRMDVASVIYHHSLTINAPIELDFMLRWQWIQTVSALDKFIHDLVRVGMIEIFQGKRQATKKYNTFSIDMNTYSLIIEREDIIFSSYQAQNAFEKRVIAVLKQYSFQEPNSIADGLSFIWDESHKWNVIAKCLSLPEKDCRIRLNNIYMRRNQIVHQCDCQDNVLEPQEIYDNDVEDVKRFVFNLGNAIYSCVKLQH